ncbi:hypothetical protein [Thiothrix subterranea]|uniref:Polyphosphate kinase N-terminal domain-containing protein n=1 Tax=Thiothrix subterranea TaxID=2735563 RepID=A0AA51MRI0_9GAMM|nr:hypothetical protein [Thiothrix subterranea]WML88740.1 hypothetical protein RCG00_10240 [Thiothrix subterranea]
MRITTTAPINLPPLPLRYFWRLGEDDHIRIGCHQTVTPCSYGCTPSPTLPNTEQDVIMQENAAPDLNNPDYYLNRELSLLAFNRRVMELAQDPRVRNCSHPLTKRP